MVPNSASKPRTTEAMDDLIRWGFFTIHPIAAMRRRLATIEQEEKVLQEEIRFLNRMLVRNENGDDLMMRRNYEMDVHQVAIMRLQCECFLWDGLDEAEIYYESLPVHGADEVERYFRRKHNTCIRYGWHIKYMLKCEQMLNALPLTPDLIAASMRPLLAAIQWRKTKVETIASELASIQLEENVGLGECLEFYETRPTELTAIQANDKSAQE